MAAGPVLQAPEAAVSARLAARGASSSDGFAATPATDKRKLRRALRASVARIAAALAIAFVAIHSPEPTMPWQRLVAICCAQHMATYGALRNMLPSVECGRRCRRSRLLAQHSLGGLKALEERRAARLVVPGPGLAIRRPNAIQHALLSSVPASRYMFVESNDSWSIRSAIVAMATRPKICCAHDSPIEIAASPQRGVQRASSRMPFALQNLIRNIVLSAT